MDQTTQAQIDGAVPVRRRARRRHSIAEKRAIIGECLQTGASLAGVALAHGVNANMVRKWVVKYQQGGYGPLPEAGSGMLPVVIKGARARRLAPPKTASPARVEVELTCPRNFGPLPT